MALPAKNLTLRFGDYDVEALLGPGSVTETYRAGRAGAGPVALKLLRADRGGQDAAVRAAFLAIAKRNKALRLPGIAKIKEIHEGPQDVFVVTELLDGANLEGLFDSATASGTLDPSLVGQIGIQIARILTRMHERREPILHGGLCPGNVVVTSGGRVTLLDPGFTAGLRPLSEMPFERSWFAAPEVALDGQSPSVASDLYSLGAVLYYLLTGEPPVMGETLEELAEVFEEGPPDLPGLPDWLHEAVFSLLARDPEDRPRSAAAAALCLSPFPDGATRLGAIVNGSYQEDMGAPQPTTGRGTLVLGAGEDVAAFSRRAPSTGSGLSLGALEADPNPFDGPDSAAGPVPTRDDGIGLPSLSLPDPVPPPATGAGGTTAKKPTTFAGPLTLTPLRPAAVVAPEPVLGPPSVGLANEPQWAGDVGPGMPLSSQWGDSGLSLGDANEPKWAGGAEALDNEPKWADTGVSPALASRSSSLPVDDFLDIGVGTGGLLPGLSARVQDNAKVELPDLVDVDDGAKPSVVATSYVLDSKASDEAPLGLVSFGAAPGASAEVGAIGFSDEEGEGADQSAGTGSRAGIVLPQVPRRAGSARRAGEPAKKATSRATIAVVAVLVCAAGAAAFELLTKPEHVLPSPQELAQKHGEPNANEAKPVAQNVDEVAPPARGSLSIVTTPQGATIWVDGKERGRTPLTIETSPGTHRIVVIKPGFKMLREVTDTSEGLTIKRTLPPANINFGGNVVLKVECKTSGKYPVFVDGKDTGLLCPIENLKIPAGNRLIGVYVIPDNKIWSFEREVVAGSKPHRVVFSY